MNKKSGLIAKITSAPHLLWSAIFIIVPLCMVAYYSFTDSNGAFTLNNIASLGDYRDTFIISICYALITTIICFLIAYPLAYIISETHINSQRTLMLLILLPMWTNFLLRTYSLMQILDTNGIINNFLSGIGLGRLQLLGTPGAVIFGMVYDYLPYMIMPIYSVLSKLDKNVIEAAEDLGCNRLRVIMKVVLPLSVSGIVSGITMVFVPSVSTFYISQKLGGDKILLVGDKIESLFGSINLDYNVGSAMSLALMVMILLCMAIMNRFSEDGSEEMMP